MGYICLSCFNEYYKEGLNLTRSNSYLHKCPSCKCGDMNVAEIDDILLPVVKKLNQKGYITQYCCSGHTYEEDTNTYISFDTDTVPKIIPKGFVLEDEEYYKKNNWTFIGNMICIRKAYNHISKDKLYEELLKTHLDLMKWVDSLEYISEDGD